MNTVSSLKCVIMGDDLLSISCAEYLLTRGFNILSFISQSVQIRHWAEQKKIPCFNDTNCFLESSYSRQKFDFLFSIVYFKIIPSQLLILPRKFAVNYHDSLLPKYAGLHATSWALLNGEIKHGVSWHLITDKVDTGDLLLQKSFDIEEKETAFTLNLKCHQQALNTFKKLINLLISNQLTLQQQDLSLRTYFGRYAKLPKAGIIDWKTSSEQIDKLCRALYFGEQQMNTLGTAKFIINNELYLVEQHEIAAQSGKMPGIVSEINNEFIQIATQSQDIRLIKIKDIEGNSVSIADIVHKHKLRKGSQLANNKKTFIEAVEKYSIQIAPYENFWVKQFNGLKPLSVPFVLSAQKNCLKNNLYKSESHMVSPDLLENLIKTYSEFPDKKQILLSALLAYFYRLNNYESFSIAFSYPGMDHASQPMGLFSNWVPFLIDFDLENKFQDVLITVAKHYEEIVQNMNFKKDLFARHPHIINKSLQLAIIFSDGEQYSAIQNSLIDLVINTKTNFIRIYFSENYATVVNQILNHFVSFIESLCQEKNKAIKYHALLSAAEYRKVVVTWNQTGFFSLNDETLNRQFEKQVAKDPNKIAIISERKVLSYSELNAKVNQLTCYIQEILVTKNNHVVIYLPRSIESIICMLAILKSGNTYVPITVETPLTRVQTIVADCDAQMLLTESHLEDQLDDIFAKKPINLIKLDLEWQYIETINTDNLKANYSSSQIAYVLYTSGSTGEPKGVQITQRSLVNFLLAISQEIDFSPEDILLAITPITFDISGLEIYLPLMSGASCIFAGYNTRLDPQKIADSILKYKVTIMQATPATWQMLMSSKWNNERCIKMLCGGEELNTQLATQLVATGGLLWNLYGPTETTIWSTAYRVEKNDEPFVPIGKSIANTQVYVLDNCLQPVPIGISGMLYIGGSGVAQGYLNKPQLTQENFVRNPFLDKSEMMYNTGDQVRWLKNGNLVYSGRTDNQVKIRGYRIEPGEIETRLLQYSGISQAIVLNKITDSSHSQLVAYLVLTKAKKDKFNRDDLIDFLKNNLLEYMIPSHFIFLDDFPINSNGKIDKKALLALPIITKINKSSSLIPTTFDQQRIAHIWAEILAIPQQNINLNDNFFSLGGNSLLAVQAISCINELFSLNLNIATLFTCSTIKKLAKLITKTSKSNFKLKPIPILNNEPQPLLDNQSQIWFLNKFTGNSAIYNIAAAWELKGELNYSILGEALTEIIKRQGVLRTRFCSLHGKPTQQLQSPELIQFNLKPEDLANLSEQEIQDTLKRLAAEPFHMEEDYLFRFRLFKVKKNSHILYICLHHVIADGWSFGILYRELSQLYRAYYEKKNPSLPSLAVQYIDYCAWQKDASNTPAYEKQIEYWQRKLEHLTPLELPTDYPRPLIQTYQGRSIHFNISTEEALFLRNFAKAHHLTLFTVMLSAFAFLLSRYTNQADVAIGVPFANRNREFMENIIGCFINTIVIRLDLSANHRCIDLLKNTLDTLFEAQENSDLYFGKLISLLHPDRDQSHNPVFQIMFAFNNTKNEELDFPDLISHPITIESNYAHMELSCFIEEKNNHIEGYIEYNQNLFSQDTVKRIVNNYLHVLKEMTLNVEKTLDKLGFLSLTERKILLTDWSNIKKEYPKNKNLIELFEEQVKNNPSKTALIYQDEQISYQALNQRANQLAYYIQKATVGTKGYIGVYFKRSVETIIAFLAIMKSGNAYIPIDEEAPLFLIKHIIDEAKLTAVLTTKQFFEIIKVIVPKETLVILIDEQSSLIQKEEITNLPDQSKMHLAYVLYTSGSTGKPKGVQITHHSLVNLMFAMRDEVEFTAADIALAITPLTFDLSVPDIYLPLTMGASVVLADTVTRFDANRIIQHIQKYNITIMQATPTTWKMLVQENWRNESGIKIICGGERLKTQLAEQLCASHRPVWNFYGPPETTVWATCHKIKSIDKQKPIISIGHPLANIEVFVVNQDERLTPIGVPGELYIGGAAVGEGYLNDSEMTNQQFVSDIFLPGKRKKLYKTGDLVVWSPTGELHYVGRKDTQIKIRGYRIDPESIETVLNKHPAIFESVILDKGPANEHELIAYLVLKEESLLLSNIQDYLFLYLPIYMVPTKFVVIKQFPLTGNGKINRNVLPQLTDFRYLIDPSSTSTLSENNYEKTITQILKKLIGLESIDPETNFFNLGIHSLLLVEFSTLLNESFNCEINVIDLFTYSSVRKLASFLISHENEQISDNFTTSRADARRKRGLRRQDRYDI